MILALLALLAGLVVMIWAADRFIESAAESAAHIGVPSLLIGIVVVGFGTSAPEVVVSSIASAEGKPGISIGNAYGSNITNIGLILGVTAAIAPIVVRSSLIRKELPLLVGVTLLAGALLLDDELDRLDAGVLFTAFFVVMCWAVWQGMRGQSDPFGTEVEAEIAARKMPPRRALVWLVLGLLLLIGSSRLIVWGAVDIAADLGVSELIIGLTVVAIGTSLPELASSLLAMRKGEPDIAVGNIVGSNIFNTLVVVGIAGAISPTGLQPEVLERDVVVMGGLTMALLVVGFSVRGPGRINRVEGGALVAGYGAYTIYLVASVI